MLQVFFNVYSNISEYYFLGKMYAILKSYGNTWEANTGEYVNDNH